MDFAPGKVVRDRELGIATVVVVVLLAVLTVSAEAIGQPGDSRRALRLAAHDPGARVQGNTIVATGARARVYGSRGRPNFIAALGSRQTIVGGRRGDHLAALGDHVTIIGGGGHDLVFGHRGARLIGGSGRDTLVARAAEATLRAGSGDVVVARRDAQVLCSRSSQNVTVYAGENASVSSTCRAADTRVLSLSELKQPVRKVGTPSAVTGDGSNDNPFVAPCDDPGNVDCTISAFPARTLSGAWANEYVPAYKCPAGNPYLLNKNYAPPFTTWGSGVEISFDTTPVGTPIDVAITGYSYYDEPTPPNLFSGTLTGFPNSTATNWLWGGSHWYRITLHCTSDRCHGTDAVGTPPGCGGRTADLAASGQRRAGS
jgi:Ca2+-binding RTX toxin-like protein